MGIAFNVGDDDMKYGDYASWSYSGFHVLRKRLAASIGIDLDSMIGFSGDHATGVRSWDSINDAIAPLLNHSDCEGELTAKECATVGPRLREIVNGWTGTDVKSDYDKANALLLADMMSRCAKKKKPLIFC